MKDNSLLAKARVQSHVLVLGSRRNTESQTLSFPQ